MADLLGKAWEKDPDAVEYGLKSCLLLVENRDFEDAAALSGKIGSYLAEHPDHPLAIKAALLAVAEHGTAVFLCGDDGRGICSVWR